MSDRLLYKTGMRVLRESNIPAILCEASFYTDEGEKKRLQDPEYQKREAYGYYLGIVDYFAQGTPTARLLVGASDPLAKPQRWVVALDDGIQGYGGWGSEQPRILPSTLRVAYDGKEVKFKYDKARARIEFSLPKVSRDKVLELQFQNIYKHSAYPTRYHLESTDSGSWQLAAYKKAS